MKTNRKYSPDAKPVADAYDDLVNAVFKQAYEDLVFALTEETRNRQRLQNGGLPIGIYKDTLNRVRMYRADVERLEDWFRNVLPNWRDINPDRIIKQAHAQVHGSIEFVRVWK